MRSYIVDSIPYLPTEEIEAQMSVARYEIVAWARTPIGDKMIRNWEAYLKALEGEIMERTILNKAKSGPE